MSGPGLSNLLEDYLFYLTWTLPSPMIGTSLTLSLPGDTPHVPRHLEIKNAPANDLPYTFDPFIHHTFFSPKKIVSEESFLLLFNWVLWSEDQILIVGPSAEDNLSLCETLRTIIQPFSLERTSYRVNVQDEELESILSSWSQTFASILWKWSTPVIQSLRDYYTENPHELKLLSPRTLIFD